MRICILFVIYFTLSSCKFEKNKPDFLMPNPKDINDIVETVIANDSLPVTRNDSTLYSFPISTDLQKLDIVVPKKGTELAHSYTRNEISIYDLLHSKLLMKNYTERDSAYFQFQNQNFKSFKVDTKLSDKLIITDFEEQKVIKESGKRCKYYYLSIPIFSTDNNRAYVEVTSVCPNCGGANSIYLEKINKKWIVIDRSTLWMN